MEDFKPADSTASVSLAVTDVEDSVVELADADRDETIAALIAQRTSLPESDAAVLLWAEAEFPAALLCRALGLSPNGYSAILRMRHRRRRDGRTLPGALLSAYAGIARPSPAELRKQVLAQARRGPMPEAAGDDFPYMQD